MSFVSRVLNMRDDIGNNAPKFSRTSAFFIINPVAFKDYFNPISFLPTFIFSDS